MKMTIKMIHDSFDRRGRVLERRKRASMRMTMTNDSID